MDSFLNNSPEGINCNCPEISVSKPLADSCTNSWPLTSAIYSKTCCVTKGLIILVSEDVIRANCLCDINHFSSPLHTVCHTSPKSRECCGTLDIHDSYSNSPLSFADSIPTSPTEPITICPLSVLANDTALLPSGRGRLFQSLPSNSNTP